MKLEYSNQFKKDFKATIDYIKYNLENEISANSLIRRVEKEIIKRYELPSIYTSYKTKKENTYYILRIKNYIVFYTVENEVMKVRRFIYNRRDFDKIDVIT